jgi:hypothetical protein
MRISTRSPTRKRGSMASEIVTISLLNLPDLTTKPLNADDASVNHCLGGCINPSLVIRHLILWVWANALDVAPLRVDSHGLLFGQQRQ